MRMPVQLLGVLILVSSGGVFADGTDRYARAHPHPAGPVLVVAEGDFEPRSIGSYSVRIYSNRQARNPTDDYVCGMIRSRDGAIERVVFADVDQDGVQEVVVTMRSAGTGSYQSADALRIEDARVVVVATVTGLPTDADCVAALSEAAKKGTGHSVESPR